jgi:hypothetical protein
MNEKLGVTVDDFDHVIGIERSGVIYSSSSSSSASPPCCQVSINVKDGMRCSGRTYGSVGSLLLFVTLLVGSSLGLEGSLLLLVEGLPLLTEDLANITC